MLSTFFTLTAFILSAAAVELLSTNNAIFNAGFQGCISAADNEDGASVSIHDCSTGEAANKNWTVSFYEGQNAVGPQQLKVFGNKCLDVTSGTNTDGVALQIWTCSAGNTNQQWISLPDQTFQWAGTNKCIDLRDGKIADGTELQIWTCDSKNNNQQWIDRALHSYLIGQITGYAGGTGAYCIAAASDTDGAEVAIVSCFADVHTTFPAGNTTWTVPLSTVKGEITTFNNKCLDVPNGSTANGVKLQIWTCTEGNTNQVFQSHSADLQIEWNGTGKCLDLTNGSPANGNLVQLWDCVASGNHPNQDWGVSTI